MSPFYDLPNVIVTPHTAWSSGRVLDRSVELFCDNLRRFATGEPLLNVVDPERRVLIPGYDRPMQIAIVGLAGSGKTTVFNTLTRGHAETGGYGGVTLNVGVVKVPDERLDALAEIFKPEEDRPGRRHLRRTCRRRRRRPRVTSGPRSCRPTTSPGCATRTRCSTSSARSRTRPIPHPEGASIRRATSSGSTSSSLLADLSMAERRIERLKTSARHGNPAEREAAEREEAVLRRIHAGLEAGAPIRDLDLDADDEKAIRGFRFLTQKPVLVLLNVGENDLAAAPALVADVAARIRPSARPGRGAVGEDRDGARRARARRGGGVHGGARDRGVGPRPGDRPVLPAARAHLVPHRRARRGPRVAGPGRLDRGRCGRRDPHRPGQGFIRAETVAYEDLLKLGSMAEARKAGRLRSEGKTYRVRDGDVLEILFSK